LELHLSNKHVVVAGGSRGIGLAIAREFLHEKAVVHIISRNPDPGLAAKLKSDLGGEVYVYSCDVSNSSALNQTALEIQKNAASGIDILVANVGNGQSTAGPISDEAQWNSVWETNFGTTLNCVRSFVPHMKKGTASMVFISSIAGIEFIGAPTDYSVAKAALVALSKSLAHRLAPDIRVNVVAPGNILFTGGSWEKKMEEDPKRVHSMLSEKVPMKRLGRPEEIADVVVFLSSEKASFITGSCVIADGGQTIKFG
jgi:3-oxoacyl-[acyl-carrier protein] reductase